jgi:hypothetical protein
MYPPRAKSTIIFLFKKSFFSPRDAAPATDLQRVILDTEIAAELFGKFCYTFDVLKGCYCAVVSNPILLLVKKKTRWVSDY